MTINLEKLFLQPEWPAPKHIKAFSSLRQSDVWGENGLNEAALKDFLQLPSDAIWLKQVHGATVVPAVAENKLCEADASYTNQPATVCVVKTADCLPVLITNRAGTEVAAVHAGWRGLSQGVIEATIAKLASPAEDLLVWLGPGIGREKFFVRQDVFDIFTANHPEAEQGFNKVSADQWLCDLYFLARQRLQKIGINAVYGGNFCTYTDQERFYSYRRDNKQNTRMVNLIWIAEKSPNL